MTSFHILQDRWFNSYSCFYCCE